MSSIDTEVFKSLDVNPGGTLQMCQEYVERLELLFQLVFRKVDGTAWDMKELFQHLSDHFTRICETVKTKTLFGQLSSAEKSDSGVLCHQDSKTRLLN